MKKPVFLFMLFFFTNFLFAQGIKGTIKTSTGELLPYASIFVPELKDGSSTNLQGEYQIKLSPGKYDIVVQYVGYETIRIQAEITDQWVIKDFLLKEQPLTLKEVEIKSKREDPALTIMRKAIAKRKFHQLQYDSYQVKVYIKGTGEMTKAPFFLKKKLKEEGMILNQAYTTESVSEIKFEQPDIVNEKVISIYTSGNNHGASPSMFIHQSFYKDKIVDVISPLAGSAFSYYKFTYEGSFKEGKIEVNKIKVTPRSRGEQVFEGYIYIIEDLWAIHSLDLSTSYMGFKIRAKQNYAEVAPSLWMPVTHQYDFSGSVVGFGGEYKYLASCSDYKVQLNKDLIAKTTIIDEKVEDVPNPAKVARNIKPKEKNEIAEVLATEDQLTRKQFRKMINEYEKESIKERKEPEVVQERTFKVDSLARKRDSSYWAAIRPVPLTVKELQGYKRDDSLAKVETAQITGKDPNKVIKKKKFDPTTVLFGGDYNLTPKTRVRISPNITQTYYNIVEGINFNLSGSIRHRYDSLRRAIEFTPTIRYGIKSEEFYAKGKFEYRQRIKGKFGAVSLEGGKFVEQFNEEGPIHPHINTLSTLFFRRHFMNIYDKTYVRTGFRYNPSIKMKMNGGIEWASRQELFLNTPWSLMYRERREFDPNRPITHELGSNDFTFREALILNVEMQFRPKVVYRRYNGRKIAMLDKSPEYHFSYRKGVPGVFGSQINFDHLELGVNHGHALGVRGKIEYQLRAGGFLNNSQMDFMDYKHFDGNRTILSSLKPAGAFRLLDYYLYSTNGQYISATTHYQFRKFLVTQLPEVRFSGLRENIFLNYLKTSNSPHYYEVGYSLDNILRVFRFEVATSFTNKLQYKEFGFRIGIATLLKVNND
jgi:hypothetical protein